MYFCFVKVLKKLFWFYIHSSIHVSVAVCSLVWITGTIMQVPISTHYFAFIFFGTITGYNFIKYLTLHKTHKINTSKRLKIVWLFTLFCGFAALYFLTTLSFKIYGILAVLALLTFFYAIPLFRKKSLRKLTGLKLFIVALVWAGVTVLLPLGSQITLFSTSVLVLFLQRFIVVIALTIPFEIRDLKNDDLALGTLPQRLGIQATKFLGLSLLVITLLLNKFINASGCSDLGISVASMVLAGIILFSNEKQRPYFASFWVEAIPIFWALLIEVCRLFFA